MNKLEVAREISSIFQKTLQIAGYDKTGSESVSALIGFARTEGLDESLIFRRDASNGKKTIDALSFFELCKTIMPSSFESRFLQIAKNRGFEFEYKPNTFLISYI